MYDVWNTQTGKGGSYFSFISVVSCIFYLYFLFFFVRSFYLSSVYWTAFGFGLLEIWVLGGAQLVAWLAMGLGRACLGKGPKGYFSFSFSLLASRGRDLQIGKEASGVFLGNWERHHRNGWDFDIGYGTMMAWERKKENKKAPDALPSRNEL